MSSLYDTDFGAWLEAQVHALATGAWAELDIPQLCDELDGVRRHYLQELEWSLQQVIEARLVWDYAPAQRSDWWQAHMNASHSHLMTFLKHNPSFRQVLGQRYPVLYQHAIHGLQRYHHLNLTGWPRVPPWSVEDLDVFITVNTNNPQTRKLDGKRDQVTAVYRCGRNIP